MFKERGGSRFSERKQRQRTKGVGEGKKENTTLERKVYLNAWAVEKGVAAKNPRSIGKVVGFKKYTKKTLKPRLNY